MARKKRPTLLIVVVVLVAVAFGLRELGARGLLAELSAMLNPAPPPEAPAAKAKAKKKKSGAGASLSGAAGMTPEPGRLAMPAAKPCLDPPTGEGLPEEGVVGSRGLEAGEVRAAMSAVVSHALPCFADAPTGTLTLSVTAGCDGRVSDIRISDDGGFPSDVTGCVVETLRYAEFPAHDLPDGYTFAYPVEYTAP